jgi:ribonuclease HII
VPQRNRESKPTPSFRCTGRFERRAYACGAKYVAGVDEVGRGSLFGPVVAAAVVLDPARPIRGLNDSKQLLPKERQCLSRAIRTKAVTWAIAAVDAGRIDQINIYQASRAAMLDALQQLQPPPDYVLSDAVRLDWSGEQLPLIHGDARSMSIAAASIIAKVYRDELLDCWDLVYPCYRLGTNKGYSTPDHIWALRHYGVTPLHRRSFLRVALAAETQSSD